MIHPVSLFQAGILVAVCIQAAVTAMGTKPENEYMVTGKLSRREVEETLQVLPCSFYRQDLVHGSLFQIVLFCGGTLAPVSYYNGSTLVEFPLCKADAPDDARYCIKNNLNTTAKGVQSFIVPAGVKLKIGTDELYPENITRLYDNSNPNPEPGKNGTAPLGPMANESDLTRQLSIAVAVLVFLLVVACAVAAVFIVLFCRKKRNPQEEQGQPSAPLSSEESGDMPAENPQQPRTSPPTAAARGSSSDGGRNEYTGQASVKVLNSHGNRPSSDKHRSSPELTPLQVEEEPQPSKTSVDSEATNKPDPFSSTHSGLGVVLDDSRALAKLEHIHGDGSSSDNPVSPPISMMATLFPVEEETPNQSPNSKPIQISAQATNMLGTSSPTHGNN